MKKVCRVLGHIELALGSVGSIILAKNFGVKLNLAKYTAERDFTSTFIIFLTSMFGVIVFSSILYSISELLDNQEKLLERLKKDDKTLLEVIKPICSPPTENISKTPSILHSVSSPLPSKSSPSPDKNDSNWKEYGDWVCPNCKRINDLTVEACSCGISRPK